MVAKFPTSVATINELLDARNNVEVILDGSIDDSVTTIVVIDTSNIPSAGKLTFIEDGSYEVVSYTGKTATSITGVTRGDDLTTATAHTDGTKIGVAQSAEYHNILADEIIAIAQNLSDRIGLDTAQIFAPLGAVGAPSYSFAGDGNTGMWSSGADTIDWSVGGIQAMRLNSAGDLCIGVGSPTEKLHVTEDNASNYSASNVTIGANILIENTNNNTNGCAGIIFAAKSATTAFGRIGGEVLAGPDLELFFQVSDNGTISEAMRIIGDGRIGIGTSSPDGKLHVHSASAGVVTAPSTGNDLVVENSADVGLTFLTPNTAAITIYFGDPDDNDIGSIQYNHSTDQMNFIANTLGVLRFESDGDVHIQPFGTADVELEVSNGAATGGGTIHRASSATHSSEAIKIVHRILGEEEEREAMKSLLDMPIKEWEYIAGPGEVRWGPTWETAPKRIRNDSHKTIVIDDRIVQLELAVKALARRVEGQLYT